MSFWDKIVKNLRFQPFEHQKKGERNKTNL